MKSRFPQSIRKYIRMEKARIRREVLDAKEQKELILKIYARFLRQPKVEKEAVVSAAPVIEDKVEETKKVSRKISKVKKPSPAESGTTEDKEKIHPVK